MTEATETTAQVEILGGFDGCSSILGVLVAAALTKASHHTIFIINFGGALAAAMSMASGQWLADSGSPKKTRATHAAAMFATCLVFGLVPVIGFAFSRTVGVPWAVVSCALLGAAVAHLSPEKTSRVYVRTYGLLITVAAVVTGVSLALGA